MAISERTLIKLGGWPLGIDNISDEHALARSDDGSSVIALRVADNVDISSAGDPYTRQGFTKLRSAQIAHSLYCAPSWPFGLVVLDGALCEVTEDGNATPLVTGLSPWDELTYCALVDRVLWSNGARSGVVGLDMSTSALGVATPPAPTLQALQSIVGAGDAVCQVTLTWQRASGEESGAGAGVALRVNSAAPSLRVSDIPQPDDPQVKQVNIYATPPNGDVFQRVASVPVTVTSYAIDPNTRGKRLDTQFLEPVPPASILRAFNARVLYARRNEIGWSDPVRPALTHLPQSRIRFTGTVTMLEPLGSTDGAGVYVAAGSRTFWLAGNEPHKEWQFRIAHPYGAVAGSSVLVSGSVFGLEAGTQVAYWLDSKGFFCLGLPGGTVQRIGANRFSAGTTARASSVLRERDGERHIVTAMRGRPRSTMAMQDAMNIRIDGVDR